MALSKNARKLLFVLAGLVAVAFAFTALSINAAVMKPGNTYILLKHKPNVPLGYNLYYEIIPHNQWFVYQRNNIHIIQNTSGEINVPFGGVHSFNVRFKWDESFVSKEFTSYRNQMYSGYDKWSHISPSNQFRGYYGSVTDYYHITNALLNASVVNFNLQTLNMHLLQKDVCERFYQYTTVIPQNLSRCPLKVFAEF